MITFLQNMSNRKRRNISLVCASAFVYFELFPERKKRSVWVKKWKLQKEQFGHMPLIREIRENNPDDFKNYLRMDGETFDLLLGLVSPHLTKQDTVMRKAITAEERLVATLRFLATGRSYEDLKFSTLISAPTLSYIIPETCKVLFDVLKKDYVKFPSTKEEWQDISDGFKNRWQVINCGGALDGKHIRIVPPSHSGAHYYNYKQFYSVVLMALVNANYEFIFIDVGQNGRLSDGGVINNTAFYKKLIDDGLDIPSNTETDEKLNFSFLSDEAFALHKHMLKPYSQRDLTYEKRIFNYRLSRGRNVVEQAFGVISNRFRVLHTPIYLAPEKVIWIILAICSLHNFLRKGSPSYLTSSTVHNENSVTHEIIKDGDWRKHSVELVGLQPIVQRNFPADAKENRENYKQFYNNKGKVEWQHNMLTSGKA